MAKKILFMSTIKSLKIIKRKNILEDILMVGNKNFHLYVKKIPTNSCFIHKYGSSSFYLDMIKEDGTGFKNYFNSGVFESKESIIKYIKLIGLDHSKIAFKNDIKH